MKISAVVAASDNNAIGFKGKLLWHLPLDMEFFKNVTMGHYVLMGRKSWDALPAKYRPLSGRVNMVITRQKDFKAEEALVFPSIDEGIMYAEAHGEKELMIIGGGEIFKQALPEMDRVYLTRVHHVFEEADAYFPQLPADQWHLTSKKHHPTDENHKYSFDFLVYDRK